MDKGAGVAAVVVRGVRGTAREDAGATSFDLRRSISSAEAEGSSAGASRRRWVVRTMRSSAQE